MAGSEKRHINKYMGARHRMRYSLLHAHICSFCRYSFLPVITLRPICVLCIWIPCTMLCTWPVLISCHILWHSHQLRKLKKLKKLLKKNILWHTYCLAYVFTPLIIFTFNVEQNETHRGAAITMLHLRDIIQGGEQCYAKVASYWTRIPVSVFVEAFIYILPSLNRIWHSSIKPGFHMGIMWTVEIVKSLRVKKLCILK